MNAIFVENNIYILLMHKNIKKMSDHFIIQKYNGNGNFVSETVYYDLDDKIYRVHIINSDNYRDEFKILIQSKNKLWALVELPL